MKYCITLRIISLLLHVIVAGVVGYYVGEGISHPIHIVWVLSGLILIVAVIVSLIFHLKHFSSYLKKLIEP
jgi:membrane protein DedA with SNARE-associated domain